MSSGLVGRGRQAHAQVQGHTHEHTRIDTFHCTCTTPPLTSNVVTPGQAGALGFIDVAFPDLTTLSEISSMQ